MGADNKGGGEVPWGEEGSRVGGVTGTEGGEQAHECDLESFNKTPLREIVRARRTQGEMKP